MDKNKILFVGSFKKVADDGGVGGQMFACSSLIGSPLGSELDWILLDTTMDSIPPPPFYKRILKAFMRFLSFHRFLFFTPEIKTILIFCGDGWSFREKGVMAVSGKLFGKKVIIAPRSGIIIKDLEDTKFKRYASYVFKKADVVLCQSKSWKKIFSSLVTTKNNDISNGNTHFIVRQNWINIEPYIHNRPLYKTGMDKVVFLYLGWLELFKGIQDLLEAIRTIGSHHIPEIHFLIAGNGSEMNRMQLLAEEHKIDKLTTFLGWANSEKKMELFRTVDAFILPSHFEGFPNALMEAMASELPCIATRVGAVEDIIENGVNGILIDAKHPEQIAEAIIRVAGNSELRVKLGKNARETVLARNSIDSAIATFREILI